MNFEYHSHNRSTTPQRVSQLFLLSPKTETRKTLSEVKTTLRHGTGTTVVTDRVSDRKREDDKKTVYSFGDSEGGCT